MLDNNLKFSSSSCQCVILIGGLGSRLGNLVHDIPKPMLEVSGVPFVLQLMRQLRRFGFTDFLLLTGYKSSVVENFFSNGQVELELNARIRCIEELNPMGTGGALRAAASHLEAHFFLCNGDSFFDCNVLRLMLPFIHEKSLARLALRPIEQNTRYGAVLVQGNHVEAFSERDVAGASGFMNTGLYYMRREIVDAIPIDKPCSLEREIFPALAAEHSLEYTVFGEGYFIDIGIPEDLALARTCWQEAMRRPAVFFDRDGVLNEDIGYVHKICDFRWMPYAREAILYANDHGYNVFVVTNQAGIARGYYDVHAMHALHEYMQQNLHKIGAHIDAFAFCPHHPEGIIPELRCACLCRKPSNGLIEGLTACWPTDVPRSFLVGDKSSDIEAGGKSGLQTHLMQADENVLTIIQKYIRKVL